MHRVQRVPVTEASGRIHTSAVTVAVLPEAEDVEVDIDEAKDLRIDVYRSSGPGGQSVNTTDSAVRVTHLPTGLVVACQDEKSQHKNKAKALKILRARLLERAQAEQQAEVAESRRSMVGSGDRSERVRTYNFPQGRVTDHRINLTLYSLDRVIDGEIAAADRRPDHPLTRPSSCRRRGGCSRCRRRRAQLLRDAERAGRGRHRHGAPRRRGAARAWRSGSSRAALYARLRDAGRGRWRRSLRRAARAPRRGASRLPTSPACRSSGRWRSRSRRPC